MSLAVEFVIGMFIGALEVVRFTVETIAGYVL